MTAILSGAVTLDRVLFDVYMAMAVEEGLIVENAPEHTDAFLRRYSVLRPAPILKQMVSEQIVLTPKVLSPLKYFPLEGLSGEIIERELIERVDEPSEEESEVSEMSISILLDMLTSRGYSFTVDQLAHLSNEVQTALAEQDEFTQRTGKDALTSLETTIGQLLGNVDYTSEELEDQRLRQLVYSRFEPIVRCLKDYGQLMAVANRHNSLMRVPSVSGTDQRLRNVSAHHDTETVVVQIASNKMGRLPYRSTLRESIELSEEHNTQAFRQQVAQWTELIERGDFAAIELIHSDIDEASRALAKTVRWDDLNRLITYAGIPVALFELITSVPPVLGISFTTVGFLSTALSDRAKAKYRWTMFGST